jgi:hypothetical protein
LRQNFRVSVVKLEQCLQGLRQIAENRLADSGTSRVAQSYPNAVERANRAGLKGWQLATTQGMLGAI